MAEIKSEKLDFSTVTIIGIADILRHNSFYYGCLR